MGYHGAMAPHCAGCGRELDAGQGRPAPAAVTLMASLAFGFFHGGLWANEELIRPRCPRCRLRAAALAVAVSLAILTTAAFAARYWLRLVLEASKV